MLLLETAACAQELPLLARNGEAHAVIILPNQPTPPVSSAAQSLAHYLQQITTARFTIQSESAAAPHTEPSHLEIHVGPTAAALRSLPDDAALHPERIFIQRISKGLLICGGGDAGTQFAVWQFLSRLGCRWLTPRPEDELIPRLSELRLPEACLAVDTAPAFQWRLFKAAYSEHAAWGTRLGFNGFFSPKQAAAIGGGLFWPDGAAGVHTFNQIIPPSQYFDAHPDWFPMRNGRRPESAAASQGQLCLTAPGVLEEFVRRTRLLLDEHPDAPVISISPDDGYHWCECPDCRRLDQQLSHGRYLSVAPGREEPFVGDRLYWFCNQVAEQLRTSHPRTLLLILAYINYVEPPDSLQPAPGIVPFICHYWPADYGRPIEHPASPENRRFLEILQRWTRTSSNVMLYNYTSKSLWWRLPRPILHATVADIRLCQRLGIRRFYCQSTLSDWEQDGPLYYLIGHLLWNPEANPEQLIDEWVQGMYGPAAAPMHQYYRALESSAAASGQSFSDDPRHQVPGLFDLRLLEQARRSLEEAALLADTPLIRDRIARTTSWFEHSYWLVRILEEQHAPGRSPENLVLGVLSFVAASSLLRAAKKKSQRPPAPRATAFLILAALIVILCWLNSIFNLQHRAVELARTLVQDQAWYQSRFLRQILFLSIASATTLAAAATLFKLLGHQWPTYGRILLALLLLLAWQLLRATAFDQPDAPAWLISTDARFRTFTNGISLQWMTSLPALLLLILAPIRNEKIANCQALTPKQMSPLP
jgi:hypothetical protein